MGAMATLMQAAIVHRYGGLEAVQLESVPRPTLRAGEVLVRVHASPVTAADVRCAKVLASTVHQARRGTVSVGVIC